jgi:hypothetical protein
LWLFWQRVATSLATGVEPTKVTALIPGWSQIASTTVCQLWRTQNTFFITIDEIKTAGVSGNIFGVTHLEYQLV